MVLMEKTVSENCDETKEKRTQRRKMQVLRFSQL
jgi:hypothetical protein